MAYELFVPPSRALDSNASPYSGAKWKFYATGTTTPQNVYADADLGTSLGSTVTADSGGKFATIYFDPDLVYRGICENSTGSVTLHDIDPINTGIFSQFAASTGSSLIGFIQSGTGAVATTVEAQLRLPPVMATNYSTVAQAVATGRDVHFPSGTHVFSDIVVTTTGQRFTGDGAASILRSNDATKHLFDVRAADVVFRDLRMEGIATSGGTSRFAIVTDIAYPAPRLVIENVIFSGASAGVGFTNAIKLDSGADYSTVRDCYIERLWGNLSGFGYGVLVGCSGCTIDGNKIIASSGRGRHGIYLAAGASYNKVSKNHVSAFDYEGITIFAYEAQSTCYGNIVVSNTLTNCVAANVATSGSISIARNCQNNLVSGNIVNSSGGCGILIDGSAPTGDTAALAKCFRNHLRDNIITLSRNWGIQIKAMSGGSVVGNDIYESSQAGAGTYSNIQVTCSTTASLASLDILFSGNRSTGATNARSAFNADSTSPVPTGLVLKGNYFPTCQSAALETTGVTVIIDDRIRYSQTWDPASVANGGFVQLTGITVTGAAVGDAVDASFSNSLQGMSLTGYVTAANTCAVTLLNTTGGAIDLASGTLKLGVRKESY